VSTPKGPGETPGRNWREMPAENVYELQIRRDAEVVEIISLTRNEYHVAKQIVGEMRLEQWMHLAPTLTWRILAKRGLSALAGASAALVALKWYGHLAISWPTALAPLLVVIGARLARLCLRELAEGAVKQAMEWTKK
jgi:hypothetical protein